VIADLEDGVGPADKAVARTNLAAWLASAGSGAATGSAGPQRWVRIDPDALDADIAAAESPALTGVVVAKAEVAALQRVDDALGAAERRLNLPDGTFVIIPLMESAAALADALTVARAARVLRLAVGEVDMTADLGLRPGADGAELVPHRFQIVAASAAAAIARPLGPTSVAFRDLDTFLTSGQTLLRQGFRGRTAIHPAQIPVIHQVFTPTADELRAARDLLARLAAAGGGVAVDARGRMIDAAVARSSREIVALAEQIDRG
jgi:citrate lyase subunit beta/citryl-CoA lyase